MLSNDRIIFFLLNPAGMKLLTFCDCISVPSPSSAFKLDNRSFTITSHDTYLLFVDLGHNTGTNRMAAFTDRKSKLFVHCYGSDQLNIQFNIITRHHHLRTRR